MADTAKQYIRNVLGRESLAPASNAPSQYGDRRRQYFGAESAAFAAEYAKYASDFFSARAQGLNAADRSAWQQVLLRMSDTSVTGAAGQYSDDYKTILIATKGIDYIPQGAKFEAMGSTWLAINPKNISGTLATALVRRCNAVWRHTDYYGNILSEPVIVENILPQAATPAAQETVMLTRGSFNIICQYNGETAQLGVNSRLLLGRGGYAITGINDFFQEFTEDIDSVRLISFSARYTEPNPEIDDIENRIAGGKADTWEVRITGSPGLREGQAQRYQAEALRGGVMQDGETMPISYIWTSSNPAAASVDESGNVQAVGPGETVITAVMAQNPNNLAGMTVTVAEAGEAPYTAFLATTGIPQVLPVYTALTIQAAYFSGGAQTEEAVSWMLTGAPEDTYSADIDGNTLTVHCWGGSVTPLRIEAACKGTAASTEITLQGI